MQGINEFNKVRKTNKTNILKDLTLDEQMVNE